jgi:hypothetical protein
MNERDRAITGCIATHTKLSNDIVEPTTTAFMPNLKRLIYDVLCLILLVLSTVKSPSYTLSSLSAAITQISVQMLY